MRVSEKVTFLNIGVRVSDYKEAVLELVDIIKNNKKGYVCFLEVNLLAHLIRNPDFSKVLNTAAIVYPDGMLADKLSRIYCGKSAGIVSGPSLFLKLCEYGVPLKLRHYLYGGAPGVAECTAREVLS